MGKNMFSWMQSKNKPKKENENMKLAEIMARLQREAKARGETPDMKAIAAQAQAEYRGMK